MIIIIIIFTTATVIMILLSSFVFLRGRGGGCPIQCRFCELPSITFPHITYYGASASNASIKFCLFCVVCEYSNISQLSLYLFFVSTKK